MIRVLSVRTPIAGDTMSRLADPVAKVPAGLME